MTGPRRTLEEQPEVLALGPSSVLHAVADKVVDDYLAVVDAVNQDIEEIESSVFGPAGRPTSSGSTSSSATSSR